MSITRRWDGVVRGDVTLVRKLFRTRWATVYREKRRVRNRLCVSAVVASTAGAQLADDTTDLDLA